MLAEIKELLMMFWIFAGYLISVFGSILTIVILSVILLVVQRLYHAMKEWFETGKLKIHSPKVNIASNNQDKIKN